MNPWTFMIAALVGVALLGVAVRALAQSSIQPNFDGPFVPNATPVAVALTNDLPSKDLEIVILRRTATKPHDVVLVRPRALDAVLLAQAVQTLQTTRRHFGRIPTRDLLVKVEHPGATQPPRAAEAVRWVASLRSAKPVRLPGVGTVPLILLHPFDKEISSTP